MLAAAGSGSTTAVVNTAASGTEIQFTQTAGGTLIQWISGRAPSGGFTLTAADVSIWAHESGTSANAGGRFRIFKRTAAGSESELGGGAYDDGVEFTKTTPTEMLWTANPTDTAFAENDRILIKLYITNVGTMGGSQTCTLTYNAADAATGDSFFNIAETVTFKPEDVVLAGTSAAVSTAAVLLSVTRGIAGASAAVSTVAGVASVTRGINGASAAASTVAGELTVTAAVVSLDGASAAVSAVAGQLSVQLALAGTSVAVSTAAGSIGLALPLAGTSAAVSTAAGAASIALSFSGTTAALSGGAGSLAMQWALRCTSAAVSSSTGELSIVGQVALDGIVTAVSTVSGSLSLTLPFTAAVVAQSGLSGSLSALRGISGAVVAVSTVAGTAQLTLGLRGVVAGASALSCTATMAWALRSLCTAALAPTGDLTVVGLVVPVVRGLGTASESLASGGTSSDRNGNGAHESETLTGTVSDS